MSQLEDKLKEDIEIIRDSDLFDKKTQDIRKSLLLISSICILLSLKDLGLKSFLGFTFSEPPNISLFSGALTVVVFYEYINFIWNVYSNHRDKKIDKEVIITTYKLKILHLCYQSIRSYLDVIQANTAHTQDCADHIRRTTEMVNKINKQTEYALNQVNFSKKFENTSNSIKKIMTILIEFIIPVSLGVIAIYKNYHNLLAFLNSLF